MKKLIQTKINILKTLLDAIEESVEISVYIDNRTYYRINLVTGELNYYYHKTASCGCCSYNEHEQCNINELSESSQVEIMFGIDLSKLTTQ